jgi:restriction endonuclease Mrr
MDEILGYSDDDWKDVLLNVLTKMDPSAFERLCQRVLREYGFTKVKVTGKVGDGGIDGGELCELLKELQLGTHTELVEKVTIDPEWFPNI